MKETGEGMNTKSRHKYTSKQLKWQVGLNAEVDREDKAMQKINQSPLSTKIAEPSNRLEDESTAQIS